MAVCCLIQKVSGTMLGAVSRKVQSIITRYWEITHRNGKWLKVRHVEFTGERETGYSTRICLVSPLRMGLKSEESHRRQFDTEL